MKLREFLRTNGKTAAVLAELDARGISRTKQWLWLVAAGTQPVDAVMARMLIDITGQPDLWEAGPQKFLAAQPQQGG